VVVEAETLVDSLAVQELQAKDTMEQTALMVLVQVEAERVLLVLVVTLFLAVLEELVLLQVHR
jgi:hypothetical protein